MELENKRARKLRRKDVYPSPKYLTIVIMVGGGLKYGSTSESIRAKYSHHVTHTNQSEHSIHNQSETYIRRHKKLKRSNEPLISRC